MLEQEHDLIVKNLGGREGKEEGGRSGVSESLKSSS